MDRCKSDARKRLTVILDPELERSLHAERDRLGRETGLAVSMNQVATRAMRAALKK